MSGPAPLRIVHVTRAPVGGIFRHILDLARGQAARGHAVGILCDSTTGGPRAEAALAAIAPVLELGIHRIPIQRELSPTDVFGFARVSRHLDGLNPDVLHGHGAKGGAFVRLKRKRRAIRVYTPHGGSLHYGPRTLRGFVYSNLERVLMQRTDLFLFESAFARDTYHSIVGTPAGIVRVVPNGITPDEMVPVAPDNDAADIVYVGEFRRIKGADILIDAIDHLHRAGRKITASVAGDGEERAALHAQAVRLGLNSNIHFIGHVPARKAFSRGRLLVVPSRGDSLPYVVLEAAGAAVPMIATRVGGIPEVFGPGVDLVPPNNPARLAQSIAAALDDPAAAQAAARQLRERIQRLFSQDAMVESVLAAYDEAIKGQDSRTALTVF
jgi:glycosyltransferase involved in cell wall biosynthesis